MYHIDTSNNAMNVTKGPIPFVYFFRGEQLFNNDGSMSRAFREKPMVCIYKYMYINFMSSNV